MKTSLMWSMLALLFAVPALAAVPGEVYPRMIGESDAVTLVDEDGASVGAIGLVEKDGYYGFMLVTATGDPWAAESAEVLLDSEKTFRFRCLALVQKTVQMLTCVTKSPVFYKRLSSARSARLVVPSPPGDASGVWLEATFSGSGLQWLLKSGGSSE